MKHPDTEIEFDLPLFPRLVPFPPGSRQRHLSVWNACAKHAPHHAYTIVDVCGDLCTCYKPGSDVAEVIDKSQLLPCEKEPYWTAHGWAANMQHSTGTVRWKMKLSDFADGRIPTFLKEKFNLV